MKEELINFEQFVLMLKDNIVKILGRQIFLINDVLDIGDDVLFQITDVFLIYLQGLLHLVQLPLGLLLELK
jgi:hypothetical protein